MNGLKLLVDPILVGTLDFGIPWLYDAAKRILKNFSVMLEIPNFAYLQKLHDLILIRL